MHSVSCRLLHQVQSESALMMGQQWTKSLTVGEKVLPVVIILISHRFNDGSVQIYSIKCGSLITVAS
jgi:hypothetical protein